MLEYTEHCLDNGLRLILHRDVTTPLVSVNLLYDVGSRDEDPDLTGFAHLFEHLMFSGTPDNPSYDTVVNSLGGESNAFTGNDYTDYYITVPAQALPQALALEADRMRNLDVSQHNLDVQRQVVTEEYTQRYINQPYGDAWLRLRALAYTVHPYRWCPIGRDIAHVQNATLGQVRSFYDTYYRPNNAILAIAGNFDPVEATALVHELFAPIAPAARPVRHLPVEPDMAEDRRLVLCRDYPSDAVYMAFLTPERLHPHFVACDLLSDILASGTSSYLHERLVRQSACFSEIDCCVTADADRGMLLVYGKVSDDKDHATAERELHNALLHFVDRPLDEVTLQKVKNKFEANLLLQHYKALDRAVALCQCASLGDTSLINTEPKRLLAVTHDEVMDMARRLFASHSATVVYERKKGV
ncbi:MAG: insulinase family protein [Bacteroidales bacterium]|nr:insulinase family protein [Bacteroidales bacterium]